jgi:hypothetical protein
MIGLCSFPSSQGLMGLISGSRIHEEFDNGECYYTFHGKRLHVPVHKQYQPSPEFLTWHNENIFRG